jgi:hypothetical protein
MNYLKEKVGDDTGMQTRVWGTSGWLFLHSIAQNYPWRPTLEQRGYYLNFFRLIGNVLPCRYCRESYQQFISEPETILNDTVMENRKSLVTWLYLVHNKVNKKLGITSIPKLSEVWNKYESFRSKCTKSPEVKQEVKKGCLDPLRGFRKKCVINIIDIDENGKRLSFGKNKKIKLISIKRSNRIGKKFMATFEIGSRKKVIHFGAKGASDYIHHHDKKRKQRYLTRHHKDLGTRDPSRAGYLSTYILWNRPTLNASIRDYRRRLNIYNKTGKFPTKLN